MENKPVPTRHFTLSTKYSKHRRCIWSQHHSLWSQHQRCTSRSKPSSSSVTAKLENIDDFLFATFFLDGHDTLDLKMSDEELNEEIEKTYSKARVSSFNPSQDDWPLIPFGLVCCLEDCLFELVCCQKSFDQHIALGLPSLNCFGLFYAHSVSSRFLEWLLVV